MLNEWSSAWTIIALHVPLLALCMSLAYLGKVMFMNMSGGWPPLLVIDSIILNSDVLKSMLKGASCQHLPPPFGNFELPPGTTWCGEMARLSQQY